MRNRQDRPGSVGAARAPGLVPGLGEHAVHAHAGHARRRRADCRVLRGGSEDDPHVHAVDQVLQVVEGEGVSRPRTSGGSSG